MLRQLLTGCAAGALLMFFTGGARAEEEPPAEPVVEPSPLAELREEHLLADAEPEDPIEYLRSFREWLLVHETPPPRTEQDRTLYDVWKAALEPRAKRMTRRVNTLMARRAWFPESGTPLRVNPEHWSRFIRELAGLNAELNGAWRQYANVQLQDRKAPDVRPRFYGYAGYGYPALHWHGAVLDRQAWGSISGPVEIQSYWNLMRRYRLGWGWRTRECYECELRRRELQKTLNEDIAERRRLLETTRDTLRQQALSLQLLAATMQVLEEQALRTLLNELPPNHRLRGPAEEMLVALRDARLAAERYSGSSSSEYGQLLRDWVRAYHAGRALLDKEPPDDEADESAETDGD